MPEQRETPAMNRLLREPLFHFLLLGAILFGVYAYADRGHGGVEQSKQIQLTIDDLSQLVLVFKSQWRRDPTPEELQGLVEDKVREEVLYREALALGLDKDDTIVKRQLARKMEFLAETSRSSRTPSPTLRAWRKNKGGRTAPRARSVTSISPDRRGKSVRADADRALARLRACRSATRGDNPCTCCCSARWRCRDATAWSCDRGAVETRDAESGLDDAADGNCAGHRAWRVDAKYMGDRRAQRGAGAPGAQRARERQ
jgi:hypothetical protein